jgi:hypothetical protein
MRFSVAASDTLGLPAPPEDRRWLIYSLAPESQAELQNIQDKFMRMQNRKTGGSLSVGIEQAGIAARDPALADSRWESWLQTSAQEGFFELWTGTISDLLRQSGKN